MSPSGLFSITGTLPSRSSRSTRSRSARRCRRGTRPRRRHRLWRRVRRVGCLRTSASRCSGAQCSVGRRPASVSSRSCSQGSARWRISASLTRMRCMMRDLTLCRFAPGLLGGGAVCGLLRGVLELADQQHAGAFELDHLVPVAGAGGVQHVGAGAFDGFVVVEQLRVHRRGPVRWVGARAFRRSRSASACVRDRGPGLAHRRHQRGHSSSARFVVLQVGVGQAHREVGVQVVQVARQGAAGVAGRAPDAGLRRRCARRGRWRGPWLRCRRCAGRRGLAPATRTGRRTAS